MSVFTYSAAAKDGKIVKGEREAENQKILAEAFKAEGLLLLEAKEKGVRGGGLNFNIELENLLSKLRPVSVTDKMFFARSLAVMVGAGLSLTRALEALSQESANPKFRQVIADVNGSVLKGKSFADSLRVHENVFGTLFINMIEVGETTGKLTIVLRLLASQMKKDHTLKKRVRGAMLYPAIIIIALLVVGTLMMIYVVPTLTQTIKELGVELPLTTRIIISISDGITNYGFWFLLGLVVIVFGFFRVLKTKVGKETFDAVTLKLPLFGPLVKKFNVARFSRTLAYLITSGVPIVRSLEITSSVLGNTFFRKAALEASQGIQKGMQLNQLLSSSPLLFEPVVLQMIKVGEETGKVSSMLLRLALFFEEDVTETTKNLSTVIEPVLMIIIGGIVGLFAISMLQPIYSSLGKI